MILTIILQPQALSEPEYRPSGLPRRKTRLPKRYRDLLPAAPPVVEQLVEAEHPRTPTPSPVVNPITKFATDSNSYGVYRVYNDSLPTYNPDIDFSLTKVADGPSFAQPSSSEHDIAFSPFTTAETSATAENPFANDSVFGLMSWHYNSSNTKSLQDLNTLVHDVLLADDFKTKDLVGFDAAKEFTKLYDIKTSTASISGSSLKDGWFQESISIRLPCDHVKHRSEHDAPVYEVDGLLYRKPLEVIKAAYQEKRAAQYHVSPFEEYWKPSHDSPPERIYSELYNSNAFLQEHAKLRREHPHRGLETVIAPIMVWSDATQLTNFGNASLWPIYFFFGSQSKYARAKPSEFAAHHLAYIPKVNLH